MTKVELLITDLTKAKEKLKEAVNLPVTTINQDASIQRFEFTFELAWKLMQVLIKDNGIDTYGVKSIIREGAKLGLIDNPELWFDFLSKRNLSVHTYDEQIAQLVYAAAKNFVGVVEAFLEKAKSQNK